MNPEKSCRAAKGKPRHRHINGIGGGWMAKGGRCQLLVIPYTAVIAFRLR